MVRHKRDSDYFSSILSLMFLPGELAGCIYIQMTWSLWRLVHDKVC